MLAPERAGRPFTVPSDRLSSDGPTSGRTAAATGTPVADCPLCEGHEDWTPPETFALRPNGGPANSPGWMVRAVPNKYPVLGPDEAAEAADSSTTLPGAERGSGEPDLFLSTPASGAHEVIVHAPIHVASIAELAPEQLALAVQCWGNRLTAHEDAAYAHLIVNEGLSAGASLEHTHAQLYGLRFVPALVAREREHFTAHHTRTMGGCLLCDLLQEEVRRGERLIAVNNHHVLLAPYASRLPYELQLVPRAHATSIADAGPESNRALADLLRDALVRLRKALGGLPPFNLWLRAAPKGAEQFHWHIDIVPRLTHLAGLELGAGVSVNVYRPERVATELRSVGEA